MAKQSVKNYLRLDKIPATEHNESVVHETEALLAGHWVNLGVVLDPRDREVVGAEIATEGGTYDALVAPTYRDKGYADFDILFESVPAGEPARALVLQKGDVVSFNAEQAAGVAQGDDVEIGADGFGIQKAETGEVIGKCIQIEYEPEVGDLVVIRIA